MIGNILFLIFGYLCGSLSWSILIGKLRGVSDIREEGSHNAGATNSVRVLGWKWGLLVLLLDMAKAAIPLLLFISLKNPSSPWLVGAVFAIMLGHLFPIFHNFKGGKGVAVLAGSILTLFPLLGGITALAMIILILITKIVSLSAMLGAFFLPIGYYVLYLERDPVMMGFFIFLTLVILWTHRKNVQRLIRGEESKLSFRRKD